MTRLQLRMSRVSIIAHHDLDSFGAATMATLFERCNSQGERIRPGSSLEVMGKDELLAYG
jgi:hypothetical protein